MTIRTLACPVCKDVKTVAKEDDFTVRLACGHRIRRATPVFGDIPSPKRPGASIDELRGHIIDMGAAFNIDVQEVEGMHVRESVAWAQEGRIQVPPITSHEVYAAALHELGHLLAALGGKAAVAQVHTTTFVEVLPGLILPVRTQNVRLLLELERAAWLWARHYALDWTTSMEAVMRATLGGYEHNIGQLLDDEERREAADRQTRHEESLRRLKTEGLGQFFRRRS